MNVENPFFRDNFGQIKKIYFLAVKITIGKLWNI